MAKNLLPMMFPPALKLLLVCFLLVCCGHAQEDNEPFVSPRPIHPSAPNELDEASQLDDRPFVIEASQVLDVLSNVRGGVERGTDTLGSLNVVLDWNAGSSIGWHGTSFHAHAIGNFGGPFTDKVGDYQTVDSIEAPNTVNFYQAYLQQRFADDRLSVILGLYAVDSEFDVRETAGLFVHSSPGTGGDIGQLGINGPGIFPVGALGARLKFETNGWYGQAAMVEGVPGDPNHPFGNTFHLERGEGLFVIGEAGRVWTDEAGQLGKVALGGWGFTRGYETILDPSFTTFNRGGYLSLEKTLSRESDPTQGLGGYLRVGFAEGRVNPLGTFLGGGLVYTGAIPGRDSDQLGLSFNSGFASSEFLRSGSFDRHETNIELTYAAALNKYITLQPDLQYIINPGFDPALKNSVVVGLRAVFFISN